MLTLENSPGLAELLVTEAKVETTGEQFVRWAQDSLEQGHDSPSLLRLAIEEPPFWGPDLRRLFHSTVAEIGIEPVSARQAMVFHAQEVAVRLVTNNATPEEIATLFARMFPSHEAEAPFSVWWELEEAFSCDYCREGVQLRGAALHQAILDELNVLLSLNWRTA